jgi:hypothetical protein
MKIHSIPRSNGDPIEGLFELLVADSGQGDTFRFDKPADPGRYLHTFELFLGSDGKLALVVATLEDWNEIYRDGRTFASFAEMKTYLDGLDPCAHLPETTFADTRARRIVTTRYQDRRDRFLKQARGRVPS